MTIDLDIDRLMGIARAETQASDARMVFVRKLGSTKLGCKGMTPAGGAQACADELGLGRR